MTPTARRSVLRWMPVSILVVVSIILVGWTTRLITRGTNGPPDVASNPRFLRLIAALELDAAEYNVTDNVEVYKRYARVIDRKIKFAAGQTFSFDVWSRTKSGQVVVAIPFDSSRGTFTLIREHSFAHGRSVYSFPAGVVEAYKHSSLRDAAAFELEEEGHMACVGQWHDLLNSRGMHQGVPQDKYQSESIFPFLCDKTAAQGTPRDRDDEEQQLHIQDGITPAELLALAYSGAMQANIVASAMLALHHMRLL